MHFGTAIYLDFVLIQLDLWRKLEKFSSLVLLAISLTNENSLIVDL